jgi:hypothetical protein
LGSEIGGMLAEAGMSVISKVGGKLGEFANAAVQGFQTGGPIGAIIGVLVELLTSLETIKESFDIANEGLGAMLKAISPLFKVFVRINESINKTLIPIFEKLTPLFDALGSVLELFMIPMTAMNDLMAEALPIFQPLFDALKEMAKVIKDVVDFFKDPFGGGGPDATFDEVKDELIKMIEAGLIEVDGDGLIEVFGQVIDVSDWFADTAGDAAEAMDEFGEKAKEATEQLTNVPSGFKIAAARFGAAIGAVVPGAAAVPGAAGAALAAGNTIIFENVQVGDPEEFVEEVNRRMEWDSYTKTGTTAASSARSNASGALGIDEIGDSGRSFSGAWLQDRRVLKKRWEFETTPQQRVQAEMIRSMVNGGGHSWDFESDLYSSKGLAEQLGGGQTRGLAADGSPTWRREATAGVTAQTEKFGTGSFEPTPATTNLLPADSRDAENAPTGYSAVAGGSLGSSTSVYLQGTKSVAVTCASTGDGVDTGNATVSSGTAYVASVWVQCAATEGIDIQAFGNVSGFIAQVSYTFSGSGNWVRFVLPFTTGGSDTAAYIRVISSTGAQTFWADAFQIETGSDATPWTDAARSALAAKYPISFPGATGITMSAWVWTTYSPGPAGYLFLAKSSTTTDQVQTYVNTAGDTPNGDYTLADGTGAVIGAITSPWTDGAWHHWSTVIGAKDNSGNPKAQIYIDGVLGSEVTMVGVLDVGALDELYIGSSSTGTLPWLGYIDEVHVVPFAGDASYVAALAARTAALPGLPYLEAGGDFAPDTVEVRGMADKASYAPHHDGSAWRSSAQTVGIELKER